MTPQEFHRVRQTSQFTVRAQSPVSEKIEFRQFRFEDGQLRDRPFMFGQALPNGLERELPHRDANQDARSAGGSVWTLSVRWSASRTSWSA